MSTELSVPLPTSAAAKAQALEFCAPFLPAKPSVLRMLIRRYLYVLDIDATINAISLRDGREANNAAAELTTQPAAPDVVTQNPNMLFGAGRYLYAGGASFLVRILECLGVELFWCCVHFRCRNVPSLRTPVSNSRMTTAVPTRAELTHCRGFHQGHR